MSSGEVSYLMPKKETMYKSSLPAFLKGPITIYAKKMEKALPLET